MPSVLIPFSSFQFLGNETEQKDLLLDTLILQQTGFPLAFSQSVLKYKQNLSANQINREGNRPFQGFFNS